ncbi:MAG: hypothetical protein ACT4QF_02095 [Sporichthyaceae bacterium]
MDDESVAEELTELLRASKDPLFRRLRELLPARGVNVEADVLAQLFPDEANGEFGVVATADRRVFTFALTYGAGDERAQAATAVLGDWTELTTGWQSSPYAKDVADAFEIIGAR